jgi:hypothetical protein
MDAPLVAGPAQGLPGLRGRGEVVEVRELGDVTVAALRIRSHGASSDAPFDAAAWQAAEWRQGKCIRWRILGSRDEALEAVGLSE